MHESVISKALLIKVCDFVVRWYTIPVFQQLHKKQNCEPLEL